MSPQQILNKLILEGKVFIRADERRIHDSLRVSLARAYKKHQATVDALGFSDNDSALAIHSSYDPRSKTSSFFLRKKKVRNDYELLP